MLKIFFCTEALIVQWPFPCRDRARRTAVILRGLHSFRVIVTVSQAGADKLLQDGLSYGHHHGCSGCVAEPHGQKHCAAHEAQHQPGREIEGVCVFTFLSAGENSVSFGVWTFWFSTGFNVCICVHENGLFTESVCALLTCQAWPLQSSPCAEQCVCEGSTSLWRLPGR